MNATPTAMAPSLGDTETLRDAPISLHLAMTGAEGCAVRALGVIVRRGWYLQAAELHPGWPGEPRSMTVHVLRRDGERALETLKRQLERLHDMETVTVVTAANASPAPEATRHD